MQGFQLREEVLLEIDPVTATENLLLQRSEELRHTLVCEKSRLMGILSFHRFSVLGVEKDQVIWEDQF